MAGETGVGNAGYPAFGGTGTRDWVATNIAQGHSTAAPTV